MIFAFFFCMLWLSATCYELPNEPSARVVVTKKGIDKAHEVIRKVLIENLKGLKLYPWNHTDKEHIFHIKEETKIVNHTWPEYKYEMKEPKTIVVRTTEGTLNVTGKWNVTMLDANEKPTKTIDGNFWALLKHFEMEMPIVLGKTTDGKPTVEAGECVFSVKLSNHWMSDVELKDGLRAHAEKNLQVAFNDILRERICHLVQKIINENTDELLDKWPVRMNLTSTLPVFVDYRLLEEPKMQNGRIWAPLRGGMFWKGSEGTPFKPIPVPEIPDTYYSKYMLIMQATDYLMNSYMYAMHKNNILSYILTPDSTPDTKDLLQVTCKEGKICFGTMSPDLVTRFPGHPVHLNISTKSPINFTTVAKEGIRFNGVGEILAYIPKDDSKELKENLTLARADFEFSGEVKNISMGKDRIFGDLLLKDVKIILGATVLTDLKQETLDKVAALTLKRDKSRFRQVLDDLTGKGIPFPMLPGMIRHGEYEIVYQDKAIIVCTDFKYRKQSLRKEPKQDVKKEEELKRE